MSFDEANIQVTPFISKAINNKSLTKMLPIISCYSSSY